MTDDGFDQRSTSRAEEHAEEHAALKTLIGLPWRILVVCGVLIALAAVVFGAVNNHATSLANKRAQAACLLFKEVAEAPLSPHTTDLGMKLAAGTRIAYVNAGCRLGPLGPPDPRIIHLLPPGVH